MPVIDKQNILAILQEVCDPEVPVLSILDLGLVRDIKFNTDNIDIEITLFKVAITKVFHSILYLLSCKHIIYA